MACGSLLHFGDGVTCPPKFQYGAIAYFALPSACSSEPLSDRRHFFQGFGFSAREPPHLGRVRIHHELNEALRDFHLLEVRRSVQQDLSRSLVRRHVSKSCRSCCWTMKSKRTPGPLNTGRPDEEASACAVAIARRTIVAPRWSFFKVVKATVTSWRI